MEAGDLVWVEFDPAFGHEQSGRRPAVVISNAAYNSRSSFTLVCPITTSLREWPFHVTLQTTGAIKGSIIADQMKSIDRRRIVSPPVERIDPGSLARLREILQTITGPVSEPD